MSVYIAYLNIVYLFLFLFFHGHRLSIQSLVSKLTVLSVAGVYQHAIKNPESPVVCISIYLQLRLHARDYDW